MASSPSDGFERLAAIYDAGFEATLSGETDRLESILDEADAVIATLPRGEDTPPSAQRAAASWHRLQAAMGDALDETRAELAKLRSNKKVARAYGSDRRRPGLRHDSCV